MSQQQFIPELKPVPKKKVVVKDGKYRLKQIGMVILIAVIIILIIGGISIFFKQGA
jgi:hypothetical protein